MKRLLLTPIIVILFTMMSTTSVFLQAKERGENLERDYDAIAGLTVILPSASDYYFNTNRRSTDRKCGFAGGANLRRKNDAPIHIDLFNCLFDVDSEEPSFPMTFSDDETRDIKEMSLQLLRNSMGEVWRVRMWLTDTNGVQYAGNSDYSGPAITQENFQEYIQMDLNLEFKVTVKQGNGKGKGKGSGGTLIFGPIVLNYLILCVPDPDYCN